MDGFYEGDSIPSFDPSDLIEEVTDDDNDLADDDIELAYHDNEEGDVDNEDDDNDEEDADNKIIYESSSSDSYEAKYRAPKRFKKTNSGEDSFKLKVMKVLKQSCKVAGDYAVSGKIDSTPLVAILVKVILFTETSFPISLKISCYF